MIVSCEVTQPALVSRIEPRWPIALVLIGVFALLAVLPLRVRVFPIWVPYVVTTSVIVPMAALSIANAKQRWLKIETLVTFVALCLAGFAIIEQLKQLLSEMLRHSGEVSGLQLLASSIAIWLINVLIFSLLYWRIDRGGPEARVNGMDTQPDWIFPLEDAPKRALADWRPTFVDYLFVAFCTATAFSPAEAQPVTSRAKLLMMLESSVSLITVVVVAARAINILGN